jgi:hypothetical protein
VKTLRRFETREEAFQQLVRERVAHEVVEIGCAEVLFHYDEAHPDSRKALGNYAEENSKHRRTR